MHTYEIRVTGGRVAVAQIRSALFAFPEVLDVLAGGRPDLLVVVYWGRPRPAEWCRHLCAVGYQASATRTRRRASAADAAGSTATGRARPSVGYSLAGLRTPGGRRRSPRSAIPPSASGTTVETAR